MTSMLIDAAATRSADASSSPTRGDSDYVPSCGLAVIETLAGVKRAVNDPFVGLLDEMGGKSLQSHQAGVVAEVW